MMNWDPKQIFSRGWDDIEWLALQEANMAQAECSEWAGNATLAFSTVAAQ